MKWYIVRIITLSVKGEIADKSLRDILLRCMRLHTHGVQNFDNG